MKTSSSAAGNGPKRIKWEPIALFAVITLIGVAFVAGGQRSDVRIGPVRGRLEQRDGPPISYRIQYRNGEETSWMTPAEFTVLLGERNFDEILKQHGNQAFQFFNITSWWALGWVTVGLLGQLIFMGRMVVQWIVSERRGESVVPPIFWYLSLVGGLMLFAYFVWRQDIVGVLGQTSGVAIYMRNLRLIAKQRRRERA